MANKPSADLSDTSCLGHGVVNVSFEWVYKEDKEQMCLIIHGQSDVINSLRDIVNIRLAKAGCHFVV